MKIKILLAEDDTNLGFMISDQLRSDGYYVTLCSDGAEAFKRFNEDSFHSKNQFGNSNTLSYRKNNDGR